MNGHYQVSNMGKVRNNITKRILKQSINRKGYNYVSLSMYSVVKTAVVHRLVALAFIPNPENLPQVNHIDGNKINNCVENLEWCTNRENQIHANKMNLIKHKTLNEHPRARTVLQFDKDGHFVKEWNCIKNAADYYNINRTCIEKCLHKKQLTAKGFQWRYKEREVL